MEMAIRAKWDRMIDADKCQFNGYSAFLVHEGLRRKSAERQVETDRIEDLKFKKRK